MGTILKNKWLITAGLILLFPLTLIASENGKGDLQKQIAGQQYAANVGTSNNQSKDIKCKDSLQDKDIAKVQSMPVYRPPLRGAPAGRVAGGTRGEGVAAPFLCTLVPEHIGLTVSEQPTLYFFLDKPINFPIEFTIIKHHGISPLVETRIDPPISAGIHTIRLSDYGKHLKQGIQYKWFVALIPDEQHRAKDILAAGGIERVAFQNDLKEKLHTADAAEAAAIYAETGIWYDALASLSRALARNSGNNDLLRERAFLLEQVGLSEAALYESQRSVR